MQNKRVLRIRKPPMLLRKRSSSCRLESTDLNIAIVQAGSSFLYNATYCLKSIFLKTVSSVSFSLNRHLSVGVFRRVRFRVRESDSQYFSNLFASSNRRGRFLLSTFPPLVSLSQKEKGSFLSSC